MKKRNCLWLGYRLVLFMAIGLIFTFTACDDKELEYKGGGDVEYTVTISDPVNGTVTADPLKGLEGTQINVTATPAADYKLKSLVYRASKASGDTTINRGRFNMPADNVTISAVFEPDTGAGDFDYAAWQAQLEAWRLEMLPLVSSMTEDEKYGQMTQGEYDHVGPNYTNQTGNDVSTYFLGSVLSGGHSGPQGGQGTPAQWVTYTNLLITDSMKTPKKIPVIYGQDDMHGASKIKNATMLPHEVGLGAIAVGGGVPLGKEMGYKAGLVTGQEMLAAGIRWTFGPVLGVPYDIRWGRTYECYSENIDIVKAMGPSVIRGMYDGGVAPSSKHFGPEGQTANGTNGGNAIITIDAYRPIVQPYQAAIEAGVMCVMASYGSRNGVRIHEDRELLTDLLKDELGFAGMIITDWNSINNVSGSDYQEKLGKSINAGVDMVMAAASVANWKDTITGLKALVAAGTVSRARIDDAVMRILLFKRAIPDFWNPAGATDNEKSPLLTAGEIRTEGNKEIAADLVAKSLVLLKNEGNTIQNIKTATKILLVGTGGDDIGLACGGWTVSWQGAAGPTTAGVTIKDALTVMGKIVTYSPSGAAPPAGDYDAVIAVISETPYAEGDGDRTGNISERDEDATVLQTAITAAGNKPLVLVIYSGRPLHLGERAGAPKPEAIVAAWWPGSEAGTGIANVLFGNEEFVGKTAYTWTKTQGGDVLYAYGHGLRKAGN